MGYTIIHSAKVLSVQGDEATVAVDVAAAGHSCGGCALAASCSRDDKATKSDVVVLQVRLPLGLMPAVGEVVSVGLPAGSSVSATLVLLALPLALFLIAAVACTLAGLPDTVSALAALGSALLCYAITMIVVKKCRNTPWVLIDNRL